MALKPQGQPADVFDCVANPDPVGVCCGMEGGCGGCPTDVDDSGDTGPFDLAFLLGNWGSVTPASECLDADGNGEIGPFDLAFLLGNWGACDPPLGGEGCAVMRGFECGQAGGVYLGDGTSCDDCNEFCNDKAGNCCVANGTPGCNASDCCHYVCDLDPLCCDPTPGEGWTAPCAQEANDTDTGCGQPDEACEPTECLPEIQDPTYECIATGSNSGTDGYLGVVLDNYGSFASAGFGGGDAECSFGDMYNPAGAPLASEAIFSSGPFIHKIDTLQRELLSAGTDQQGVFDLDFTMFSEIPDGADNVASDTNGDGVNDRLESSFIVCGPGGIDLQVSVTLGAGETQCVCFVHTYGSKTPALGTCPAGCDE